MGKWQGEVTCRRRGFCICPIKQIIFPVSRRTHTMRRLKQRIKKARRWCVPLAYVQRRVRSCNHVPFHQNEDHHHASDLPWAAPHTTREHRSQRKRGTNLACHNLQWTACTRMNFIINQMLQALIECWSCTQ